MYMYLYIHVTPLELEQEARYVPRNVTTLPSQRAEERCGAAYVVAIRVYNQSLILAHDVHGYIYRMIRKHSMKKLNYMPT
jgi:hypothetical protein